MTEAKREHEISENLTRISTPQNRRAARLATVEQHIRLENEHDLEGVLRTFGNTPQYDDQPWGGHYEGRHGVRQFYEQLMKALPDLEIDTSPMTLSWLKS